MGRISADVIIFWKGTHATIPAGFVRETRLDDRYPKGTAAAVDPNVSGGSLTHTHTSPAHYHTLTDHTHNYTIPSSTNFPDETQTQDGGNEAQGSHGHNGTTAGVSSGGETTYTAVTYGAVSNDPPFTSLIPIRSLGAGVPTNAILFSAITGTLPTGWQNSDGTNSTYDLRDKFIKGASTAADSGATGGSYTNVHDITHGHSGSNHSHYSSTSGYINNAGFRDNGPGSSIYQLYNHQHGVNFSAAVATPNNYSGTLTTAETVQPAFKKLMALANISSGRLYDGMIAMWLRPLNEIPAGWILCDGSQGTPDMRGWFVKVANNVGEIGSTGGSNTHGHAAQSHYHTSVAHNHYHAAIYHYGITMASPGGGSPGNFDTGRDYTYHPAFYTDTAAPNFNSSNTTGDTADNQPNFLTVAYIMFKREIFGGAFFLGLM